MSSAATRRPPRHFIKEWRLYRGYTQEQLAEMTGVTHGALSQLERGLVNYTQTMLEALAVALRCEPADLIMRDPNSELWSVWDNVRRMSVAAASPVELWYSVHQHGNDLCLSPGWPTKNEAMATGHMKAGKFLGVICSGWLHPAASMASAGRPRIDKLLDDLHAIPDSIALIEDELRYSIGQLRVDPQDAELTTRVAEALAASNPLCFSDDGQHLLEFTELAKMKPHLHELLLIDARAAIQAMAEALSPEPKRDPR